MDPVLHGLSFSSDDFNFESCIPLPDPNQSLNSANLFESNEPTVGLDSFAVPLLPTWPDALNNMAAFYTDDPDRELVFPAAESNGGSFYPSVNPGMSSSAGQENTMAVPSSCPNLKYMSQMITMEENMEERVWISHDDFALQNTEKSLLYGQLGEQYSDMSGRFKNFDATRFTSGLNSSVSRNSIGNTVTSIHCTDSVDPQRLQNPGECNQTIVLATHPLNQVPESNLSYNSRFSADSLSNSVNDTNDTKGSNGNDPIQQFKKGLEEASKFLPPSSELVVNLENFSSGADAKGGKNKGGDEEMISGCKGRKNRDSEDLGLVQARANKQIASYGEAEEPELSDMLDKVLLCTKKAKPLRSTDSCISLDASKDLHTGAPLLGSSGRRRQGRRRGNNSSVDLRALLLRCAHALSSNDLRTASELLKQIRKNSSPSGDGSQRLAHHFANGLEARMAGNVRGTRSFYSSAASERRPVADVLKVYQLHFSACPFKRLSIFYTNYMIWKMSHKATILHIIDFGIGLGFKWPTLIQKLGEQASRPLKLRITGIELPQPGFRPAQRIEETGHRLARYCERFNVPFEYTALPSQNWESIKIEDLKIKSGETIAVTCLMRFENLLDETAQEDSPRDAVLNLVRSIKPNIFVHAIRNGSYNTPFFVTRFREALFHLSSIYDMYDATISDEHRDSKERADLESEFYGRQVMNAVACEGPERVERPETYKQWRVRHEKAGFKQLPLDRGMMEEFRRKIEAWYHEDFVLDEDGGWMLLGWKGRIIDATTCLVPM